MKMLREWIAALGVCMAVAGVAILIFSYESATKELKALRLKQLGSDTRFTVPSDSKFQLATNTSPTGLPSLKRQGRKQVRDAADTITLGRSPDTLRIYRTYSDDEKIDKTCGTNILDQKPCALDDTVLARDAAASIIKNGKDCLR
jgi:hypothetical protein